MSDDNKHRNSPLSPASLVNEVIVSSRYPHTTNRSNGLQYLLAAENQAAEMVASARIKRNELIRQANQESQIEIEIFRQERENQYQIKLQEATQLKQFQAKLDEKTSHLLEEMEQKVKKAEKSVVDYIVHCVIDDISFLLLKK